MDAVPNQLYKKGYRPVTLDVDGAFGVGGKKPYLEWRDSRVIMDPVPYHMHQSKSTWGVYESNGISVNFVTYLDPVPTYWDYLDAVPNMVYQMGYCPVTMDVDGAISVGGKKKLCGMER